MSLKGEISLIRTLTDHAVWQGDLALRGAWIDLLLRANTEPAILLQRGETVEVKRGQLAWSIQNLAKKWGVCDERAAKMLAYLQKLGCIRVESSRRRTVITICNYEVYQTPLLPVADAGSDTDSVAGAEPGSVTPPVAESVTGSATEPVQRREKGVGREEERAREGAFAEVPSEAEILAAARSWQALAFGAPRMDEQWALAWFARMLGRDTFPRRWRTMLPVDWRLQWREWQAKTAGQKPGAVNRSARTENPVARRIALERRVRSLEAELEGHALNCSAPPYSPQEQADFDRVRADLKTARQELESVG